MRRLNFVLALVCIPLLTRFCFGEDRPGALDPDSTRSEVPMSEEGSLFNVPSPTLGGRQFWGDVTFRQGWRIQQNVFTEHFRLLDASDTRRAWGTREACQKVLDDQHLPATTGEAVVFVHGIIRSSKSFDDLQRATRDAGFAVIPFDYPSTRVSISDGAKFLTEVLDSLQGVEQIHFVVHSMGGLVVRNALKEPRPQWKLGRMVMLGVPNQGAQMANIMQDNILYKFLYGPAGQELVADPAGFIAKLPAPPMEFAVIAGARGTPDGWNPLIPGDDDGTVSVEATALPGAADFMTVPALHSFMMSHPAVQSSTLHFLRTGALHKDSPRQPIPIPVAPAP